MNLSSIGTGNLTSIGWKGSRPTGSGASQDAPAADGYAGPAPAKLAGRPTFTKASSPKGNLLTGKAVTMLVTAMTVGSLLIGLAQPAFAAPPQERPAVTQVVKKEDAAYQAGQQLHKAGKAVSAEAAQVGQQVRREAVKAGRQIGDQATEVGKQISGQATEHGKEIGTKAAEVGKEFGQVGKEIGQVGKEVGLGVARGATSFWNGLRGK